jgi:hypothetical protein
MAPLWGFLIAVTGQTDREEREVQAAADAGPAGCSRPVV